MNKLKYLTTLAVAAASLITASAQNDTDQMRDSDDTDARVGPLYRAHEFSIDGFGSLSLSEQDINHISGERVRHDARLGAGAGVNLFFTRTVGIGADAWRVNTTGKFIDNTSGNLIVRFPIGDIGLAPYVFGGGGYQFNPVEQWFGQGGGGLEFRFCQHAGIFVDARYILPDKTDDYGLGRAGLRFNF